MTEAKKVVDAHSHRIWDVIMVGAGPASLSAALYTSREDITTLLFEKGAIGGYAAVTDWIDNYPGFPKGVAGLELADNLRLQAERFGAIIELGDVLSLKRSDGLIELDTTSGLFKARAVLLATGSDWKKIGVPGEKEYFGRGVHYCATCDGAFYRDKRLAVIGGGNSAVQEAIFLTRYASHIDLLVRGDSFRASEVLQHELKKHREKITIHLNTTTDEIVAVDNKVHHVLGTRKTTGKKIEYPVDGVFVFVGLEPNTQFLKGSGVELDEIRLIKTNDHLETSVKGIFSAGDCRSGATMQIASATGEGAKAALEIREYLNKMKG